MPRRAHGWGSRAPRQPIPEALRRYVLARDAHQCRVQWDDRCQGTATEADHIVTEAAGGPTTAQNLRGSCSHCNAARNLATRPRPRSSRRPTQPPPGLIR